MAQGKQGDIMTKLLISLFTISILNLNTLSANENFATYHLNQTMEEETNKTEDKSFYYIETKKIFEQSESVKYEELPAYFTGRCFYPDGQTIESLLVSGTFTEDRDLGPVYPPKTYKIVNIFEGRYKAIFDIITSKIKSYIDSITKYEIEKFGEALDQSGEDLIVDKTKEGIGSVYVIRKYNEYFTALVKNYVRSEDKITEQTHYSCYFYVEPEFADY